MTACILVADGNATNRITLKVRLAAACYEVITAATAQQLLVLARSERPDLILLGGGYSGDHPVDLCRRLTEDPTTGAIPVLMLAGQDDRLEALRAGAAAILEPAMDEQMLFARIRGLLRDMDALSQSQMVMAEAPARFEPALPQITLIADTAGRGLCWKHLLNQRLPYRFVINDPEEALGSAAAGQCADLYLIAADIETRGDGLRLLSELRSRNGSRDAAFVIATTPERAEINAIALDLGAGEVLPVTLGGASGIEMAALALEAQMTRKQRADLRRIEAQRNVLWAMTDPLTGLYNRRYALPRLTEIAREAMRTGHRFAVLVMDLDRFKRVNDSFGHAAGDAVLCNLARILEARIGNAGLTARLGGEEFLAILPDTDRPEACRLAEGLRRSVEANPTRLPRRLGSDTIAATLSIGVATGGAEPAALTAEALAEIVLERADQALLSAKALGRNRVMLDQTERAA